MRLHSLLALIRVLSVTLICVLSVLLTATPTYASETVVGPPAQQSPPGPGDPLGPLGEKIGEMARKVSRIATPIASFCIALVFMMNLAAPMLPEFAQENKGYVMRALGIVAFIGFIPELVKFVAALAG
jgi:hypothetical protein